jgi:AraC-like DNA-binding protein
MNSVFTTSAVGASGQFQYFQQAICQAVIRLGARRERAGPYDAEIRTQQFGPLEFADIRCDPVVIERSRHDIAVDGGAFYFLTLQLEGVGRVSQRGREVTLQPGEFTLVDSTEPYVLRFDLPVHRLIVRVPQGELDCRIRSGIDLRAVRFAAHCVGTRLVASVLLGLSAETHVRERGGEALLASSALDLLTTAMLSNHVRLAPDSALGKSTLLARIKVHARANLRDPDLSPGRAAVAAGISVRYLHQIFQCAGTSFGAWVREERLACCRAEILDPAQACRSISDIAFGYGFNDAAHFSRVFARRFGCSPRALRTGRRTGKD